MGRGTRGWGLEAPQRSRGSPSQVQQDAQGPFVQDLARHNLTEENNFGNSIVADVERLAPISSALSSYNDAGPLNSGVLFANVQLLAQSLPILDNLVGCMTTFKELQLSPSGETNIGCFYSIFLRRSPGNRHQSHIRTGSSLRHSHIALHPDEKDVFELNLVPRPTNTWVDR